MRIGTTGPKRAIAAITASWARAFAANQSRSSRLRRKPSSPNSSSPTVPTAAVRPALATARTGSADTPCSPEMRGTAPSLSTTAYVQTPSVGILVLRGSAALHCASLTIARFEFLDALAQPLVLQLQLRTLAAEPGIVLPPVDPRLLRRFQRRNDQPELDGQQLDVEEVHPDVTSDHDAGVEHP